MACRRVHPHERLVFTVCLPGEVPHRTLRRIPLAYVASDDPRAKVYSAVTAVIVIVLWSVYISISIQFIRQTDACIIIVNNAQIHIRTGEQITALANNDET